MSDGTTPPEGAPALGAAIAGTNPAHTRSWIEQRYRDASDRHVADFRFRCLELANRSISSSAPEELVAAAKTFAAFVLGEPAQDPTETKAAGGDRRPVQAANLQEAEEFRTPVKPADARRATPTELADRFADQAAELRR